MVCTSNFCLPQSFKSLCRGLVHKSLSEDDDAENANEGNNARSGQLTGMAQDQDVVITPDVAARESRAEVMVGQGNSTTNQRRSENRVRGSSGRSGNLLRALLRTCLIVRIAGRNRQLRDIVQDSTERWLLPTDDADREYYEELRAMGYQVEAAEERSQALWPDSISISLNA